MTTFVETFQREIHRTTSARTILNIGCGPKGASERLDFIFDAPGWSEIRLDIDPEVDPDILASIVDMSSVADGSFDAAWASHLLEHLYPHEVPIALAEVARVLRPGGFFALRLPDLQRAAELIAAGRLLELAYQSRSGPVTAFDMVYGHRDYLAMGNTFMSHHTGFTARTLAKELLGAGYFPVTIERTEFELWAIATKPDRSRPTRSSPVLAHAGASNSESIKSLETDRSGGNGSREVKR